MSSLNLKRGDSKPDLVITVTDPGATFQLVESWRVLIRRGSDTFEDDAPTVSISADHATAVLTHLWNPTETDTIGNLDVEVEATWPDGAIQSFPPVGYEKVKITQDLG
jgi:hypothetical protein